MQKIDIDNLPIISEEEFNEHEYDTDVIMELIWAKIEEALEDYD